MGCPRKDGKTHIGISKIEPKPKQVNSCCSFLGDINFSRVIIGTILRFFASKVIKYVGLSMTQLLLHTFAYLIGPSFRLKAQLLPNEFFLGLL